ncbi:MAG: non-hydrolyzing UDP-N-acetylglucosamine 2-epimerase [Bacteroidota bacterium]
MKIFNIVGARPQIIKSAAISRAIKKADGQIEEIVIHSGQHYDDNMSAVFFREMGIPKPRYNLGVGSDSHARQTAEMLKGFENLILTEKPEWVMVYGDTNSTVAAALAAAKLHVPVVHVEAGLRSFNKAMPEEINRVLTDHLSTVLFTPTKTATLNLLKEGFKKEKHLPVSPNNPGLMQAGDVMYDNTLYFRDQALIRFQPADFNIREGYILMTIHRDFNTDDKERLKNIFDAVNQLHKNTGRQILLPAHPRLRKNIAQFSINIKGVELIDPVSFLAMSFLEHHAFMVITDSGGVQKESFFMQKPCIVLREETEWVEIVEHGYAKLCGADKEAIISAYNDLSNIQVKKTLSLYGDGDAASKMLSYLFAME